MIRRKPYIQIGLVILKKTDKGAYELIHLKEFTNERQVELEIDLDSGEYVILPRTTGCGFRRPPNVVSENRSLLKKNGELSSLCELTLRDIFKLLDKIELTGAVEYEEFKFFMMRGLNEEYT